MTQQEHILLRLTLTIVLLTLAKVVEEDGQDATLDLDRIGQHGIEALEHVKHLVGVSHQAARVGMMHRGGGGNVDIAVVESRAVALDDSGQFLVGAVGEQVADAGLPILALGGMRQQEPEWMALGEVLDI